MSDLTVYVAPQTRAMSVLVLLKELGVTDFELKVLNFKKEEQRSAAYLAVNPMGKVPAIVHRGVLVTEQPAVLMYLADTFPAAKLAPALNDPKRGEYLRWMFFYGSCFEPAFVDRALQREPGERAMSPYGAFDNVLNTIEQQLAKHQFLLGDTLSAADVLWGIALWWTTMYKLVPTSPVIEAYVAKILALPSVQAVREHDEKLVAAQAAETA